jgi:hypothetical protein
LKNFLQILQIGGWEPGGDPYTYCTRTKQQDV